MLPNTEGFKGASHRYTNEKTYMYRQTVRAHNLITTNSTGTLPFAKENC